MLFKRRREPVLGPAKPEPVAPSVRANPDEADDFSYVRRLERLVDQQASLIWALGAGMVTAIGIGAYLIATERVQVEFVTFDSEQKMMVKLYHDLSDKGVLRQLTENYLSEYVKDRETIDNSSEGARYDRLRVFTHKDYWAQFEHEMNPANPESPLVKFQRAGQSRETFVTNVSPVAGAEGTYSVEYTTIDRQKGREVGRASWLVSIRILYRDLSARKEELRINPIGLTVGPYERRARTLTDANTIRRTEEAR